MLSLSHHPGGFDVVEVASSVVDVAGVIVVVVYDVVRALVEVVVVAMVLGVVEGIVFIVVVCAVEVFEEFEVGSVEVFVKEVVDVVSVVVDVVMGASVQLALPVLQPLQSWNGSISCDSRKQLWSSAM